MLDAHRMFHVGVLVTDLDAAMRDLGSGGLTWAEPRTIDEMPVWTPETGSRMVPLRFVYSCAGPRHVELLESPADSPWNAGDRAGIHHVGYWADDVAEKVESAVDVGWSLRLANAAPGEGFGLFAYAQPPSGLLVEFVANEIRSSFEDWWNAAGGVGTCRSADVHRRRYRRAIEPGGQRVSDADRDVSHARSESGCTSTPSHRAPRRPHATSTRHR